MVDMTAGRSMAAQSPSRTRQQKSPIAKFFGRKSTIAFFMALPLILLITVLVVYPALYSLHLASLNKSMKRFVGFDNFSFLIWKKDAFWTVVYSSVLFAVSAVIIKAIIGFIVAHFVHNIPAKGQRKWRGMLLVPWVIPPAMSTLAWLWLFDSSYGAINWTLAKIGIGPIPWIAESPRSNRTLACATRWATLSDASLRR